MEYVEKVVVAGYNQDKFMLIILLLTEDGNYECKKILHINESEKIAVHSILNEGNIIYLVDSFNNKIHKYDFDLNEYNETTVGRDPRHMCINNENIYVANFESDNISIIDVENFTLVGSIPAGIKPHDIKLSNNNRLYVSCYEENQIMEFSIDKGYVKYFNTEGKPMHIFVDDGNILAVTYFINGNIYSKINFINIQTKEIENIIKIKGITTDIDYDYINKLIYIINIEDKCLYVIDAVKRIILKKIFIGGYPESISYGSSNIYVTNSKKKQITLIDIATLSIYNTINLEFSPNCIKTMLK